MGCRAFLGLLSLSVPNLDAKSSSTRSKDDSLSIEGAAFRSCGTRCNKASCAVFSLGNINNIVSYVKTERLHH